MACRQPEPRAREDVMRSRVWTPANFCIRFAHTGRLQALLGSPGPLLGLSWGFPGLLLGLSWGSPGTLLGLSWGSPGTLRGLSWGSPGALLGLSWVLLGLSLAPPHRCVSPPPAAAYVGRRQTSPHPSYRKKQVIGPTNQIRARLGGGAQTWSECTCPAGWRLQATGLADSVLRPSP